QEQRLQTILKLGTDSAPALKDSSLIAALDALTKAAASSAEQRPTELLNAMRALRRQLEEGSALDGRLGASLEQWMAAHPYAEQVRLATGANTLDRQQTAWAILIKLRRDDELSDDAELFLISMV